MGIQLFRLQKEHIKHYNSNFIMKDVIITLAGASSRFSKSVGKPAHKSIYCINNKCLLFKMLDQLERSQNVKNVVIVTGYQDNDITLMIDAWKYGNFRSMNIFIVHNQYWKETGSNESMLRGLLHWTMLENKSESVVCIEGDLSVSNLEDLLNAKVPTISRVTSNAQSILDASRDVLCCIFPDGRVEWVYDREHKAFPIREQYTKIFASGQMWEFNTNSKRFIEEMKHLADYIKDLDICNQTNLDIISRLTFDPEIFVLKDWVNCNTIDDLTKALTNDDADF